jgi:hypothetical protein
VQAGSRTCPDGQVKKAGTRKENTASAEKKIFAVAAKWQSAQNYLT